jgi:MFS transporter, DHA2 family, multidrug resistance protein
MRSCCRWADGPQLPHGPPQLLRLCITGFTVSSFLCGAAPSLPILLLCFRVMQGAFGGGMQPMAQAIMADSFEPHKRGQAFALYGLVAVLAPSIGPTLGGWITDNFSWRWIFFINIPVGILGLHPGHAPGRRSAVDQGRPVALRNMDYMGLAFLTIAMGGLQIMLDKGEENDWFSSASSASSRSFRRRHHRSLRVGVAAERSAHQPAALSLRNFAICCFLMMLVGGVLNANTVLQPQFTQQLLGYTATTAGLALTAGGVALVFMMPLAGFATGKVSARYLAAFGFTMLVITFRYAADVTNLQMSFAEASWLRVVQMLPLPFCFISITTAAYVGMPREQSNQVAGSSTSSATSAAPF